MSATTADEARVRGFIEAADKAASSGQAAQALRLLEEARLAAPQHPAVLNALGMHAFKTGDFATGRRYLEEAVALDARSALTWFHLALVCRAQADSGAEMMALERALALDAYFYLALLQKATLLERQSKPRDAAQVYGAFLKSVPQAAQQAPAVQKAMQHARAAVAANAAALEGHLRSRLAATLGEHDAASVARFEHCLDVLLGKKRVYTPEPTFMHFPFLPALEFYDRAEFPWLDAFEKATEDMRGELIQVLASDAGGIVPYVAYPDGVPLNQWKDLNHSRRWGAYYLLKNGARLEEHLARCPKTAALLAQAPLADVPDQAPTAFFSVLEPHTHIPAHTGVTNTRLVVHVPLVVPPGCRFRVGSETREWQAGQAWVFDDTIEHEAWNDSDLPRAILIIDVWNPFLTAVERALVSSAIEGVVQFYGRSPIA
jgi:aspartyl/asparaginyl beta-hydroxylase (cupin superfamily)/Tfp pilus assembly protein PilF